jgi:predicted nucleic acid-binding protein
MGSLSLPAAGSVYLDANAFIYSVERIEPYRGLLEPAWRAAQVGALSLVTSELTLLETLVLPLRRGDEKLVELFRAVLHAREVRLVPATATLWEEAARLRAALGMKTPDALHAATATSVGCAMFITNDAGFLRVSGLNVVVLEHLRAM